MQEPRKRHKSSALLAGSTQANRHEKWCRMPESSCGLVLLLSLLVLLQGSTVAVSGSPPNAVSMRLCPSSGGGSSLTSFTAGFLLTDHPLTRAGAQLASGAAASVWGMWGAWVSKCGGRVRPGTFAVSSITRMPVCGMDMPACVCEGSPRQLQGSLRWARACAIPLWTSGWKRLPRHPNHSPANPTPRGTNRLLPLRLPAGLPHQ